MLTLTEASVKSITEAHTSVPKLKFNFQDISFSVLQSLASTLKYMFFVCFGFLPQKRFKKSEKIRTFICMSNNYPEKFVSLSQLCAENKNMLQGYIKYF